MKVDKRGKTTLRTAESVISVSRILYVPKLAANLPSASRIVENGNVVTFDQDGCTITNKRNEVIASCKVSNGMYKIQSIDNVCMLARSDRNAMLWHRRLGHMGYQRLKQMRDIVTGIQFSEADISNCEVCAKGKQTRLPFKRSETKTSNLLEIIHSDR